MVRARVAIVVWAAWIAVGAACDGRRRPSRPIERAPEVAPRAATGDALEYTLRFPAARNHYVEVEAVVPTGGHDPLELSMAVWTPGSYLVREYARHVDQLSAATTAGDRLAVDKSRKNRWRIATGGAERVVVRYRLYARERNVRGNFVADDLAVLNGAPTFLTPVGDRPRPFDVALELPDRWAKVVTALPAHPSGDAHRFLATDYDQLVDSPIVAGNPEIYEFEVEGVPHALATFGGDDVWDNDRAGEDLAKIVEQQVGLWGVIPYSRYVFLNVAEGGGGGLEHKGSTLLMTGRWSTRTHKAYLGWLGLASHEFFHTWNVKRLRPRALGPFDYENEVYTRSLWIAEGLTSYYDDLILARAGLMKRAEYLDSLSRQIESLQTTPGRLLQSLSRASFDAWIEYYRRDENSRNTTVSYYTKGALVGWLLDAEIRRATRGARSLDDVMRLAYARYAGEHGYTPAQFRAVADEVAGRSLAAFFDRAVDGTGELDYAVALGEYGLHFPTGDDEGDDTNGDAADETPGWIGARLDGARVREVPRETPAYDAGLDVDDELIAVDDYRVKSLADHFKRYRPGDRVELLVARRGRMMRVPVTLGDKPEPRWKLSVAPHASAAHRRNLQQLLGE